MDNQEQYARLVISELLNDAQTRKGPRDIPLHQHLQEVLTRVGLKLEPIEYTGED